MRTWIVAVVVILAAVNAAAEETAFRVRPYLLHPAADAMTVRWLSERETPGLLLCDGRRIESKPVAAEALDYHPGEPPAPRHPTTPFLHSIRIDGLQPATSYPYTVEQDGSEVRAILTTAPPAGAVGRGGGVRLFLYADSETQPESRGNRVAWPPSTSLPGGPRPRWVADRYLADETTGYRMNLALMASRAAESLRNGNPVLACVVGDLVETGGEQRDWDEFWRHNAGDFGTFASRVPLLVAAGNHDVFGGPPSADPTTDLGGFSPAATGRALRKFETYFEFPANNAADPRHEGRYHRLDFGPLTMLTLDSNNTGTDMGADDTNLALDRDDAPQIPDCLPGSEQHAWLEKELIAARDRGAIVFVQFHHAPFSSGMHGRAAGIDVDADTLSGQPLRALAPLFAQHGVRAVFCGHDEMYEHSFVDGVHYYDVGIGGDGLRGPHPGVGNPRQIFLAHDHAPERWQGDVLVSGGKHYGHVEVDVVARDDGRLAVSITPVHVFPLLDPTTPGVVTGWERRIYEDVVSFDVPAPATPASRSPETR